MLRANQICISSHSSRSLSISHHWHFSHAGAGAQVQHSLVPRLLSSGLRPSPCLRAASRSNQQRVRNSDYIANKSDEGVLSLPARIELDPEEITHVFGYPRDFEDKYFLGKVLGCGSFGVVRECLERASGKRFAVKTIDKFPKRGPPTPRYLLKLRSEVEIMQQIGYSLDAVNLKDVFEDNESIHLVMQLCEGGALLERIETRTVDYTEAYIARIVRSILRFVSQCHAKGFIYRDIKPDNFLFLTKDAESPLKATDFGLAIHHWPNEPKLSSRSGTPAYMAPELVLQSYDEKCDLWSVGMLTYQLLTGRFPYWENVREESLSNVWKSILSDDIDWNAKELQGLSKPAVDFLKGLLSRDPDHRPSAPEALLHPWVRENGMAKNLPLQGSVVQRLQRFSTYGTLKQMVLKIIVDKMESDPSAAGPEVPTTIGEDDSEEGLTGLKDLFKQIDTDGSGGISLEELREGLRCQGYNLTDQEIDLLGKKMDFNNNDDIDMAEFMTTLIDWSAVQRSQKWQAYLDYAFKILDLDGNGYISLDELEMQLVQVLGATESEDGMDPNIIEQAKQMLREADADGDGHISPAEFFDLLKEDHAQDNLSLYDDRLTKSE